MSRFRPAMGWLHNLSGLVLGWVLFAIFVTGACGYYRHEITLFMTPELRPLAAIHVPQGKTAQRAIDWLSANVADSEEWTIDLPDEKSPALRVSWFGETPGEQMLDPRNGLPLAVQPRETGGGDFLYRLHSDLHFVSPMVGRVLVSFLGVALLMLIVTGIVTHRNILRNLFRLRRAKGWRTRLDLHNMTGILALPFHLLVVVSGLITVMMLIQPWGVVSVYGSAGLGAFAQEAFPSAHEASSASGAARLEVAPLVEQAGKRWNTGAVGEIHVEQPGAPGMTVTISHPIRGMLSMRKPSVAFDPADGRVLGSSNEELSGVSQVHTQLFGLHVAHFAGPVVRSIMFALGLAGAAMVATGMLLWTGKRWPRETARAPSKPRRAVALTDRINAGVIAGLPVAIAAYLWSNRIIAADAAGRAAQEQTAMFAAWGVTLLAAFLLPHRFVWPTLLTCGGGLLAALGIADGFGALPVWIVDAWLILLGILLLFSGIAPKGRWMSEA